MMLSISLYAGYFTGIAQEYKLLFEWISGGLSLPALTYSAIPFWRGAWQAFKLRHPNMDLLIALGSGTTFIYSIITLITQKGATYFDSCTMMLRPFDKPALE